MRTPEWETERTNSLRGAALRRHALAAALACVMAIAAACATAPSAGHVATHTPVPATATPTIGAPTTPTPTPVAITDLGAFRQQFAAAFTSGKWARVQPFLSANFSFQPPFQTAQKSGSGHLFPPYSLTNLKTSLAGGNPWSPGSSYDLNNHVCYTGNTPLAQVLGFDGNNGHYIMFGIEQPNPRQGNWFVTWGFEDSEGGWYTCIGAEG
jgi:hypothetical protein